MDAYARKKATGGFGFSARGDNLAFRVPNHEDRQCCNQFGRAISKALAGSSSRSFSSSTDHGKPHYGQADQTSLRMLSIGESSNIKDKIVDLESVGIQVVLPNSEDTTDTSSNCTTAVRLRSRKPTSWKAASNQYTSSTPTSRHSTTSRIITQATKPVMV